MQIPENPFKPPTADVADPVDAEPARPQSVQFACQLLLVALVLSFAPLFPGIRDEAPGDAEIPIVIGIVIYGVLIGIALALIAKTYAGRNWARWVNSALLVLGWWITAKDLGTDLQDSPLGAVLSVVVALLEIAATWLLFTGAGGRWFKDVRHANHSE